MFQDHRSFHPNRAGTVLIFAFALGCGGSSTTQDPATSGPRNSSKLSKLPEEQPTDSHRTHSPAETGVPWPLDEDQPSEGNTARASAEPALPASLRLNVALARSSSLKRSLDDLLRAFPITRSLFVSGQLSPVEHVNQLYTGGWSLARESSIILLRIRHSNADLEQRLSRAAAKSPPALTWTIRDGVRHAILDRPSGPKLALAFWGQQTATISEASNVLDAKIFAEAAPSLLTQPPKELLRFELKNARSQLLVDQLKLIPLALSLRITQTDGGYRAICKGTFGDARETNAALAQYRKARDETMKRASVLLFGFKSVLENLKFEAKDSTIKAETQLESRHIKVALSLLTQSLTGKPTKSP